VEREIAKTEISVAYRTSAGDGHDEIDVFSIDTVLQERLTFVSLRTNEVAKQLNSSII